MHRIIALAIIFAISVPVLPLFAAGPRGGKQAQETGTIRGVARNAQGQPLPSHTVRCRDTENGEVIATTTSNAGGEYSFTVRSRRTCVVELVDPATGAVIGSSAPIAVVAGATATVAVGASAAGAAAAAAAAAGGSFFASTLGIVTIAAIAGGVAGATYAATRPTASGSQ